MLPENHEIRMNPMIDADVARALKGVANQSAFLTEAVGKALAD